MAKMEWFIPDMYWPADDHGSYASHEAICILNPNDADCVVEITLYFEDREPILCARQMCAARRTVHLRTDRMKTRDGKAFPRGIGYAAIIRCSEPVIVQYTRVDTTQDPLAIMTTLAY